MAHALEGSSDEGVLTSEVLTRAVRQELTHAFGPELAIEAGAQAGLGFGVSSHHPRVREDRVSHAEEPGGEGQIHVGHDDGKLPHRGGEDIPVALVADESGGVGCVIGCRRGVTVPPRQCGEDADGGW